MRFPRSFPQCVSSSAFLLFLILSPPERMEAGDCFRASVDLKRLVQRDEWLELLLRESAPEACDVYFNTVKGDRVVERGVVAGEHYKVMLMRHFPPNVGARDLILLFPNHPTPRKRVLYTTGRFLTRAGLNQALNARLQESHAAGDAGTLQLAVVCGSRMYRVHNLCGSLYLLWAERLTYRNINHRHIDLQANVPLLIETNGAMHATGVFAFPAEIREPDDTLLLPLRHCEVVIPAGMLPYTQDVDPRRQTGASPLSTLSREAALDRMGAFEDEWAETAHEESPSSAASALGEDGFSDTGESSDEYEIAADSGDLMLTRIVEAGHTPRNSSIEEYTPRELTPVSRHGKEEEEEGLPQMVTSATVHYISAEAFTSE